MFKRARYLVSQFGMVKLWKYRIAPFRRFGQFQQEWGFMQALSFCSSLLTKKGVFAVNLSGLQGSVRMRVGTSDVTTFIKIFFKKEYDFKLDFEPKLIIDAGANVGYSSVFFASKYPDAEIIAIEPEDTNFELLEHNCSAYPNVKLLKGGLWSKSATLRILNLEKADKAGYMVEEAKEGEEGAFRSYTVGELLKQSEYDFIDILKMDIEGAEKEVFSVNAKDWIGKVKAIFVELHDYMIPGCEEALNSATRDIAFEQTRKGENVALIKG